MSDPIQYNVCQYWSELEPPPCKYWDTSIHVCLYYEMNGYEEVPACKNVLFPLCNMLGTSTMCQGYSSSTNNSIPIPRCILPDHNRHTQNKKTCKSWVVPKGEIEYTASGTLASVPEFTFSDITKYNDGKCDNKGTAIECTAYMPYILGFGVIQPSETREVPGLTTVSGPSGTFQEVEYCVTASGLGYRLPLDYEILNERARLSTCMWWSGQYQNYILKITESDGAKIQYFDSKCTCTQAGVVNFKNGGVYDGRFYYRCNGASSDCPNYTGVCWRYCVDLKLKPGDKVLAEQIHELRYHVKKEHWTKELYEKYFEDSKIYSWEGWNSNNSSTIVDDKGKTEYRLGITEISIGNFDPFTIERKSMTVVNQIKADNQGPNYPTLIRQIKKLPLAPIIRNTFEKDGDNNYFETTYLMEDKEVLIYGTSFNRTGTYILNASDPEIKNLIDSKLLVYNSMMEIELDLNNPDKFKTFVDELDKFLTNLRIIAPEKLRLNATSYGGNAFAVNINTYFGKNTIFVFEKSNDRWEYDRIEFNKYFIGGLVIQTKFSVLGDGGAVNNLPYYERTYACDKNGNGEIVFEVDPIVHGGFRPEVSYVFNNYEAPSLPCLYPYKDEMDEVSKPPLSRDDLLEPYITGYKLYNKNFGTTILESNEYRVLSDGYIALTINNIELSNAIFPWEASKYYIAFSSGEQCEMQVVSHSYYGHLAPNELILYPKDINKYKSPCSHNDSIVLNNLKTYQKRSFGQEPDDEWEEQPINTSQAVLTLPSIEGTNYGPYSLTKFSNTLIIAAVLKGRSGRDVGIIKTKMLTWMKQPICPDVEIKYTWSALYNDFINNPTCHCSGPWTEQPISAADSVGWMDDRQPNLNDKHQMIRHPYCGDHDMISVSRVTDAIYKRYMIGTMWWPYNRCEGYMNYQIVGGKDYSALEIMPDFSYKDPDGSYTHGQHDLRFIGPDYYYGWVGEFCFMPQWCPCLKVHYNAKKIAPRNSNTFVGYGNIRSGVSDTQLKLWEMSGELLPQFGNASRPFARSFRSMDRIQYYEDRGFTKRAWKWAPSPMTFGHIDITKQSVLPFWSYEDGWGQNTINPLSLTLATSFDGITVDEEIISNRFTFNEVFRTRGDESILYPTTYGSLFRDTVPWYEFRYFNSDKSIQWAWQENWKPLERRINVAIDELINEVPDFKTKKPYIFKVGGLVGMHIFCSIQYPDYVYDLYLQEYSLVITEGQHMIKFIAPKKDENGEYTGFPGLQLDEGPVRMFDWQGNWEPAKDPGPNSDLYKKCTKSPWYDTSTLFDEGGSDITDENSVKQSKTSNSFNYKYIKRGLNVGLYFQNFSYLPKKLDVISEEFDTYIWPDIRDLSIDPLGGSYSIVDMKYATADGVITSSGTSELYYTFVLPEKVATISKVKLTFKYGREIGSYIKNNEGDYLLDNNGEFIKAKDKLYHIPKIYIFTPSNPSKTFIYTPQEFFTNIYYYLCGNSSMQTVNIPKFGEPSDIVEKEIILDCAVPIDYTVEGRDRLLLYLGTTKEVFSDKKYDKYDVNIQLLSIELYEETLIDAVEYINTYERKYRVSVGKHGDMAPQGDNSNALLGAVQRDSSTVYQLDSRLGVIEHTGNDPESHHKIEDRYKKDLSSSGEVMNFVNKCQGRYVQKVQPELEPLKMSPTQMEKKQKKMYDEARKPLKDNMFMNNILPPTMQEFLNDNNMFISIPSICFFENTLVTSLQELVEYSTYSPSGHKWKQSKYYESECGNTSFWYIYRSMEPGQEEGATTEAIIAGPAGQNEITQYNWGTRLNLQRLDLLDSYVHVAYPRWFGRDTKDKTFALKSTELKYPESVSGFPFRHYLDDGVGYSVAYDPNMVKAGEYYFGPKNQPNGWPGLYSSVDMDIRGNLLSTFNKVMR